MNLRNPRMIGFGISNRQTYEAAAAHAAGCIIGSRFVTLLNEEREKEICEFETKMFAKYKLLSYRNGVGDIIREQEIS